MEVPANWHHDYCKYYTLCTFWNVILMVIWTRKNVMNGETKFCLDNFRVETVCCWLASMVWASHILFESFAQQTCSKSTNCINYNQHFSLYLSDLIELANRETDRGRDWILLFLFIFFACKYQRKAKEYELRQWYKRTSSANEQTISSKCNSFVDHLTHILPIFFSCCFIHLKRKYIRFYFSRWKLDAIGERRSWIIIEDDI